MLHKKTFLTALCSLALLCFSSVVKSQNNSLGSWDIANAEYYLNKKWNLWGEVQVRSQKLTDQFYYHELKGGVNFRPDKNFGILLGTGQYGTYSNGGNFKSPVLSHEFRLWEQLTLVNNIDRIKIQHRYRIEQRWRSDGYRNRFRYRLNPIIPLNKPTVDIGTLYASIYDEIFLTNRAQYFERNRLFSGLGYQFSNPFTLQVGWIRQFDYARNNTSSKKDFLQTTLLFRINQHKSSRETHPSSMD
ncbi:MAG: DUF2490 domain-containing protein [Segetibacter sp.]